MKLIQLQHFRGNILYLKMFYLSLICKPQVVLTKANSLRIIVILCFPQTYYGSLQCSPNFPFGLQRAGYTTAATKNYLKDQVTAPTENQTQGVRFNVSSLCLLLQILNRSDVRVITSTKNCLIFVTEAVHIFPVTFSSEL